LSSAVRTKLQLTADRAAEAALRTVGEQLRHLREDAGLPQSVVARQAGIHPSYLRLLEHGLRDPSTRVLFRVTAALGSNVGLRVFPNSGPPIRDHVQARMIEALLAFLPREWEAHLEVAVYRPVRGVVDVVAVRSTTGRIVSIEAHSELRRLEQQLRWAAEKTEALPSSVIWPSLVGAAGPTPAVSRILLLRSTASTRALARAFQSTLSSAYPADPMELRAALLDPTRPWPGSGILWAKVDGTSASILRGTPRGVPRLYVADSSPTGSPRRDSVASRDSQSRRTFEQPANKRSDEEIATESRG
jgi:transcriptional regulator with XRE-family HTH domain